MNGNFRGLHGTEGKPSSLLIEETVGADGSGKLYATGRTGSDPLIRPHDHTTFGSVPDEIRQGSRGYADASIVL